jgi:hypothetical protein
MLDGNTLFGGGEGGYIDYPSWSDAREASTRCTTETV